MIKKLIRLLKPYKVITIDHHTEAHREARKLYNDGYHVLMYWTDGVWVIKYK